MAVVRSQPVASSGVLYVIVCIVTATETQL